ncbi:MAG: hypothetical protein AMXMBFR13_04210 [Phycisphaerae bacterium]
MNTTRASLIQRIKNLEDSRSWGEFDSIYRPLLRRFAAARKLDRIDAEEVAQECMAAIAEHINGFEYQPCKGTFRGWLLTMVNNRINSRLRKREIVTADTDQLDGLVSPLKGPAELFELFWMEEHLRACMEAVHAETPEQSFAAYEMYVLKGLPAEEVCAATGLKPNLLYQIKFRVNKRVLQKFRELVGTEEADAWLSEYR